MDEPVFCIGVPDSEGLGKSSQPARTCELECQWETDLKEPFASLPAWLSTHCQLEFVSLSFENSSYCHMWNVKIFVSKFGMYLEILLS